MVLGISLLINTIMGSSVALNGIVLTGGWCFYNQIYNPTDPSKSAFGQPLSLKPVYGPSISTLNDKQYIIGGWSYSWPNQFQKAVQIFNPKTNVTSQGTPMSIARVVHSAAVLDNKIVVCGGMYAWGYHLATCESYDPATNKWAQFASLPGTRVDHVSATIDNKIYVAGGVVNSQYTKSLWIYDPDSKVWTTGPDSLEFRDVPASIVHDGRLVMCGGWNNQKQKTETTCEIYDPKTNQWTYGPEMKVPRYGFQVVHFDDEMYILGGMGGHNETKWLKSVEKLDIDSGNTQLLDSELPAACTGFAAFSVE